VEFQQNEERINQEWVTLNAIRGMIKIATKGDMAKGTYDNSLDFGGELYPELLGPENSLLRRQRESETAREYRQRAELESIESDTKITPIMLLEAEIEKLSRLLEVAKRDSHKKEQTDQIKKRLNLFKKAKEEISPASHSENKLIFRDAYNVERNMPVLGNGLGKKDFMLPDGNHLRLRVLHPDRPEHITGADIIYERHDPKTDLTSVVMVQYKIWDKKALYLSDDRMKAQINKMEAFGCKRGLCKENSFPAHYRFPHCSSFLRPTDKLQSSDQKFISSGEHLPICMIEECKSKGARDGEKLEYDNIRTASLPGDLFEEMFNRGKIGSRLLTQEELVEMYTDASIIDASETVVIYAQEFK
jgi:hypothetical protein